MLKSSAIQKHPSLYVNEVEFFVDTMVVNEKETAFDINI